MAQVLVSAFAAPGGLDTTFAAFTARLASAWDARTSHDAAGWTTDRRGHGQCAVTALLVQDIFGGELMRGEFEGGSHYWNRLSNCLEIDLTLSQFDRVPDLGKVAVRPRSYVLSYPATVARYKLLRARFNVASAIGQSARRPLEKAMLRPAWALRPAEGSRSSW